MLLEKLRFLSEIVLYKLFLLFKTAAVVIERPNTNNTNVLSRSTWLQKHVRLTVFNLFQCM